MRRHGAYARYSRSLSLSLPVNYLYAHVIEIAIRDSLQHAISCMRLHASVNALEMRASTRRWYARRMRPGCPNGFPLPSRDRCASSAEATRGIKISRKWFHYIYSARAEITNYAWESREMVSPTRRPNTLNFLSFIIACRLFWMEWDFLGFTVRFVRTGVIDN